METKRFIGNDMTRLYDRVRKELGRDAVILRTRTLTRDDGPPLIELVAGPPAPEEERLDIDLQRTLFDAVGSRLASAGKMTVPELEAILAEQGAGSRSRAPRPATHQPPAPAPQEYDEPLDDGVRPLLPGLARVQRDPRQPGSQATRMPREQEAAAPAAAVEFPAPRGRAAGNSDLATQLEAAGFSSAAVETVLREAGSERNPARAIARVLDSREVTYPEADSTGIVVVLGAAGSGRTTALMKMALDCADSGREAILVAADSQRMGARQQIHAFAEATGLGVLDAHDARGVSTLAARAHRGACLFVDVPAGSFDPPPLPGIVNYAYLAVPAHWQAAALELSIESLGDVSFDGCILTFTDLAPSLAAALSLVLDSPLGLAFASAGRDVGDGMGELDTEHLVYGLFPLLTGERANGNLVATA